MKRYHRQLCRTKTDSLSRISGSAWQIFLLFSCLVFAGCPSKTPRQPPSTETLVRVQAEQLPDFSDDLDVNTLQTAVKQSLAFYSRVPADRLYKLGDMQLRADLLRATLVEFLRLLEAGDLNRKSVAESFDVYRFQPAEKQSGLLLTGYYEPILDGSLTPDDAYRYPLYSVPPDLLTIDLAAFDPEQYAGKSLKGRLDGNRVLPYFTREEIDGQGKLDSCGCAMVWLQDPIDIFFLQVQGSAMIRLGPDRFRRVGYANSNGRPYRSIGKYLIDQGLMNAAEVSLQTIRSYLREHPERRDEVMWYNPSYVFFRWVEQGPLGSLNVPLTAGRSIATDAQQYPRGGIAFLQSLKPRFDSEGNPSNWEPFSRWVLNQDTGGAIKGAFRADLFCGSGEPAEQIAGRMKHPGSLFVLIKKSP